MLRSSGVSEASFTRLTESSRLAVGWNLALVFGSASAVLMSGQPLPVRLYLLFFVFCLIERVPPASCGLFSIDAHGHVTSNCDRQHAAGYLLAAKMTALWIEFRLAGIAVRPVIWRDQTGPADWAMLRRRLLTVKIEGNQPGRPRRLRLSGSACRGSRRRKLPG